MLEQPWTSKTIFEKEFMNRQKENFLCPFNYSRNCLLDKEINQMKTSN